jgi:phenylalanyl-tRNA synthetase beta chain
MPTVTFNKSVIEKLVGKKLEIEKLKTSISMMGTNLEGIEGEDIHVEIFPNRPDLLSEQGFARALSSFMGIKTGLINYSVKKSGEKIVIDKSVSNVRPFTSCAIVKGIKFDDEKIREVIQIQEKLHVTFGRNRKKVAIGVYPMEKIKFPVTFFAEDPNKIKFQPLEFPKEITGMQILSQHPTGREYAHLLDGMTKFPFFKDADDGILSMPPIINSHDVGKIAKTTTDIFIECSGFDYNVQAKCLNIIVTALADMGGEIFSLDLCYPDKKIISPVLSPETMKLDLDYINKCLGLEIKEKQAIDLLAKMGYGYDKKKEDVLIPCYRADILHQIDLGEDIAIAYGYDEFKPVIPKVATIGEETKIEVLKRLISNLLIGLRLTEVYTYNISNSVTLEKKYLGKKPILLANSLSEEFDCLRNALIPSLLDVLARNRHNDYPQNIFDFGTVFTKDSAPETGIKEEEYLAVALCNDTIDFTRIKQLLDYIFTNLNKQYSLTELKDASMIEGRSGKIIVDDKVVGVLGEISPEVISNFGIEYPIASLEINLSQLIHLL